MSSTSPHLEDIDLDSKEDPSQAENDSKDLDSKHKQPSSSPSYPPTPVVLLSQELPEQTAGSVVVYRLYKRRWTGLGIIFLVNFLNAMNAFWFTAIASSTATHFNVSSSKVSWLVNITNLFFLVTSVAVPTLVQRYNPRKTVIGASFLLVVSGWIRYASTAPGLQSGEKAWGVLLGSQVLVGLSQPFTLCIGSKYSELWFDLKGRTTATMLLTLGLPLGIAIGQVISPIIVTDPSLLPRSILILAIINSLALVSFFIPSAPPTPPTFSSLLPPTSFSDTLRLLVGKSTLVDQTTDIEASRDGEGEGSGDGGSVRRTQMARSELKDFWILIALFGILVGAFSAFTTEVNGLFVPYGYSVNAAGNMSAGLIITGLLTALLSAPLFDRVLTHHLALAAKVLIPISAGMFMALIWVIKEDNVVPIVVVLCVLGGSLFVLLAVGLELAAEVTRQPEASSSALFFASNLFAFVSIVVMDALRAGPNGSPPNNMRNSLIFIAACSVACAILVWGLDGKQRRSEQDRKKVEVILVGLGTANEEAQLP
ncbi:major facilitator superfamily domain-containing protein [Mrakia frigida]|uniref:major facilitator superfamily domain-containing protein n=1 Tax=Mrakia frigida TaxID=29902 RepID=UPI003FCC0222